ncbi:MAG: PEP-CTERM sorting domain-containing protein [Myxococcota bacterium]
MIFRVPEPSGLSQLLAGIGALIASSRRRSAVAKSRRA